MLRVSWLLRGVEHHVSRDLPCHSSETRAGCQCAALTPGSAVKSAAVSPVAVARQPDCRCRCCPGPAAEPEDDTENVRDQGDDAVEEARSPDLDCDSTSDDDEGLDSLR